jgi:hypothetical protein
MAKTKHTIERRGDNAGLESIIPMPAQDHVWLSYWSTPEALAAHAATLDRKAAWTDSAWDETRAKFFGTDSMSDAVKLCRDGWPDGAARAERLRDRINAANPTGPRVVRWDVAGAVASVPRALAGNPLNMRRVDSAKLRRKPVITLLSDVCASYDIKAASLNNRAAVVAAVVDAAEAAGFACEVVAFEKTNTNTLAQICAVTVKESNAPADIGRMSYALGHASFFRRLTWAAFTCERFTEGLGTGLGPVTTLDERVVNERNAYILPSANGFAESYFKDEDTAATRGLNFLINALRKQDCPAFPRVDSNAA